MLLGCDSDVTQLSAVSEDRSGAPCVFDRYVRPLSGRIRRGASAVTGLRMRRGNMYYNGKKVRSSEMPVEGLSPMLSETVLAN